MTLEPPKSESAMCCTLAATNPKKREGSRQAEEKVHLCRANAIGDSSIPERALQQGATVHIYTPSLSTLNSIPTESRAT